jgi:PPM family protein phosphatase
MAMREPRVDMTDRQNVAWRPAVSRVVDVDPFRPLSSSLAVEIGAASVCGTGRAFNTDHFLAIRIGRLQETLVTSLTAADLPPRFEEYGYALVVADGLGEQAAAARASRIALSALARIAIQHGRWNVRLDPETALSIASQSELFIKRANDAVLRASWEDVHLADMATSLTGLYICEGDLFFAHVGHSRAFLFRSGVLARLTTDHTLERRRAGPSSLNGAKTDAGHIVTRSIGRRGAGPEPDIEHITLASGDRLLLCTNGLTDVVPEERIADVLALQRRPEDDCRRLVELAQAAGGADDVTVLVADYRLRPPA